MSQKDNQKEQRQLNKLVESGFSFSGNERNCCFLNTGQEKFATISSLSGFDFLDDSRGIAMVDWDFDGDLDLWISNRTIPRVRFLKNKTNDKKQHNYVMIKLKGNGTTTNKDAIGSRVEITYEEPENKNIVKLIRTVRAGDAFLSQSSKWLHFGIGSTNKIIDCHVRFPNQETMAFPIQEVNQYYIIDQQKKQIEIWRNPISKEDKVVSKDFNIQKNNSIFLQAPIPTPPMAITHWNEQEFTLPMNIKPSKAILVNFWASWCAPCIKELQYFKNEWKTLEKNNIQILALNSDFLNNRPIDKERIANLLKELELPFSTGFATKETINTWDVLQQSIVGIKRPISLPFSLLIDNHGKLQAIYYGVADLEKVCEDTKCIDNLLFPERKKKAMPFEGEFYNKTVTSPYVRIAREFKEVNDHYALQLLQLQKNETLEIALRFNAIGQYNNAIVQAKELLGNADLEEIVTPNVELYTLKILSTSYIMLNNIQEAKVCLEKMLLLTTNHGSVYTHHGIAYIERGDMENAEFFIQKALEEDKENIEALNSMGLIQFQKQEKLKAGEYFQQALKINPHDAKTNFNVGLFFELEGNKEQAIVHYQKAIKINPNMQIAIRKLEALFQK